MKKPTELLEWKALQAHRKVIAPLRMQDWFDEDNKRFEKFSIKQNDILFDYSKNRITLETQSLLCQLAEASQLSEKIEDLFTGQYVNLTESRPALHTVLRDIASTEFWLQEHNIMQDVHAALAKMQVFSEQVRMKQWLGATHQPIRDIINIGIGGSHLGPLMAIHALSDFASKELRCHFISNIDSAHVHSVLNQIDPERALFFISSKSFSTLETLTNAATVRDWLQKKLGCRDVSKHFIAITAAPNAALEFGIQQENIFPLWHWVGGRYSIWSAIGLPLALMIGMDNFLDFLAGGREMDVHFRQTPFDKNIPVMMGLLSVWYINFFGADHHAIVPYSHHLHFLRLHLQQLEMESNGKNTNLMGAQIDFKTGAVIFGEQGCNGQHAFHQMLHQGQHFVPVDFILVAKGDKQWQPHHDILIGSGLSQAQALMRGKSYQEALVELKRLGFNDQDCIKLARHKSVPGNRPSNILLLDRITPRTVGALLALYEHKTYVQGAIWQINSFDQWGVELGKTLLSKILKELKDGPNTAKETYNDASTQALLQYYKNLRDTQL